MMMWNPEDKEHKHTDKWKKSKTKIQRFSRSLELELGAGEIPVHKLTLI